MTNNINHQQGDMTENEIEKDMPDWPPQRSAIDLPDGERAYGSTGQLFEAKNGKWMRVNQTNR